MMVWKCEKCSCYNPDKVVIDEDGNKKELNKCEECGYSILK